MTKKIKANQSLASVSMKAKMLEVLRLAEELSESDNPNSADIQAVERWLERFKHERIVHLLVTMLFAILTMLSLILLFGHTLLGTALLFLLFIALTIPYIMHYYLLENGIQRLYVLLDKIYKKV